MDTEQNEPRVLWSGNIEIESQSDDSIKSAAPSIHYTRLVRNKYGITVEECIRWNAMNEPLWFFPENNYAEISRAVYELALVAMDDKLNRKGTGRKPVKLDCIEGI